MDSDHIELMHLFWDMCVFYREHYAETVSELSQIEGSPIYEPINKIFNYLATWALYLSPDKPEKQGGLLSLSDAFDRQIGSDAELSKHFGSVLCAYIRRDPTLYDAWMDKATGISMLAARVRKALPPLYTEWGENLRRNLASIIATFHERARMFEQNAADIEAGKTRSSGVGVDGLNFASAAVDLYSSALVKLVQSSGLRNDDLLSVELMQALQERPTLHELGDSLRPAAPGAKVIPLQ